jgi:hypothetical protein
MSTDTDFAAQWRKDPEGTLAKRGLRLSNEELNFLKAGLRRQDLNTKKVNLSDLLEKAMNWR